MQAAQSVNGARVRRPKRSVEVDRTQGGVSVSFELAVEAGVPVPELAQAVQERVAAARRGDLRARGRARRRLGRGDRVSGGRRAARRTALVLLYQWDVTGQELASLFEGDIDPYARAVAEGVIEEHEELDRRITEASDEWTADRLGALERNILRMAIRELDEGETSRSRSRSTRRSRWRSGTRRRTPASS